MFSDVNCFSTCTAPSPHITEDSKLSPVLHAIMLNAKVFVDCSRSLKFRLQSGTRRLSTIGVYPLEVFDTKTLRHMTRMKLL